MENSPSNTSYRRVLLKLSGEVLAGEGKIGFSHNALLRVSEEIAQARESGVEIAVVVGGGNIFRGLPGMDRGIERANGDYMGMLATIINTLALQSTLESLGISTRVMTALEIRQVAEPYIRRRAIRHLEKGRVVLFGGGTGNPFFTTDTAAALRAAEVGADILLKGTKVDGVFTSDPEKDPEAAKYEYISYMEVLEKGLRVMDGTAISLCMENNIPIRVFSILEKGAMVEVMLGKPRGTLVGEDA